MINRAGNLLTSIFLLAINLICLLKAGSWDLLDVVTDTLVIELPTDTSEVNQSFPVKDERKYGGNYLGVRQKSKFMKYVPVDEYFLLDRPLDEILGEFLSEGVHSGSETLVVDNVTIWYDGSPAFRKGWMLNGHTYLADVSGTLIREWQWEIRSSLRKSGWFPFAKKQKLDEEISALVVDWMEAQKSALTLEAPPTISPHRYRRQLIGWIDVIAFRDGYAVDTRLALDFPADQSESYTRGIPGIYYRKGRFYETFAVGGMTHHWYWRYREKWLMKINLSGRLGFSGYSQGKFDYLDWWNVFFLNVTTTAALEYKPRHHRGLFWGIGLHPAMTLLPEVVEPLDLGLVLTVGIVLP